MFNILTPKSSPERQRVTILQAAALLKVSRQYIYKLIAQKKLLPHKYLGRMCLYVDECILPRRTLKGFRVNARIRRTAEEVRKAKHNEQVRKYRKRRKQKAFDALSDEDKQKVLRRKRNDYAKKKRRMAKARKKRESGKWNSTDELQG